MLTAPSVGHAVGLVPDDGKSAVDGVAGDVPLARCLAAPVETRKFEGAVHLSA